MPAKPFRANINQDVLDDLQDRLKRTRWPDEIPGSGWDYGSNLAYVKELVDYWIEEFDWREQEAKINRYSQFITEVDGLDIHYIHERGRGPDPLPLLLIHGWPGSITEFMDFIPLLTDPAAHGGDPKDSFDVVAPSLPGYGFSGMPKVPGMGVNGIADVFARLMDQVGYDSYVAQGGDWGASISSRMGFSHADKVKAIHINMVFGGRPYLGPGSRPLSDGRKAIREGTRPVGRRRGRLRPHPGHQAPDPRLRPQRLPRRSRCWIVWRSWSAKATSKVSTPRTRSSPTSPSTGSPGPLTSTRIYYETRKDNWRMAQGERINVPTAVAVFPEELDRPVREWADRSHNVQRWTEFPRGGHFAAMEKPQELAQDMREFFRQFR